MSTIRVFLIEDHSHFRQSLAFLLERQANLQVVAQAGSLAEARRTTSHRWSEIDLVIIDLLLPDGSGTELIREMREANPTLRVLALTIVQSPKTLREAEEMGVDGVVSKAAPMEETLGAVRRLAGLEEARTGR
ncbi:MAG TPA: response regulator transcription factor [Rubrobacter sp.]